jgi:hypothetical protein
VPQDHNPPEAEFSRLIVTENSLELSARDRKYPEPIVLEYLTKKCELLRACCQGKREVAQAGGFVKFWLFSQKLALFHRLLLKACALNGLINTLGFYNSELFASTL